MALRTEVQRWNGHGFTGRMHGLSPFRAEGLRASLPAVQPGVLASAPRCIFMPRGRGAHQCRCVPRDRVRAPRPWAATRAALRLLTFSHAARCRGCNDNPQRAVAHGLCGKCGRQANWAAVPASMALGCPMTRRTNACRQVLGSAAAATLRALLGMAEIVSAGQGGAPWRIALDCTACSGRPAPTIESSTTAPPGTPLGAKASRTRLP
jgi:hypothetical protein